MYLLRNCRYLLSLTISFAGLFAASVLAVGHLLDLPVPCGGSRGCIAVAMHPASKFLGIPIAYFGIAAYVAIITLVVHSHVARWARIGLVAVTALGTLTSGWLLWYSHTVIRAHCPWCIASGMAMAVLFALSIPLALRGDQWPAFPPALVWGLAVLTSGSVGTQAGLMQRAALAPPIPVEQLANVTVDELVDSAKTLGPIDAPVTIVMFADLWCPACRAAHASLTNFQRSNSSAVRLAFHHLPLLDVPGHEFSGAAAALSEIAAEKGKFWPFVDAIYSTNRPLDRHGYLQMMQRLGIESATAERRIADAEDHATAHVWQELALAERLDISQTPTFIVFVDNKPPISASLRGLPRLLNSPVIQERLVSTRGSNS